MTAGREVNIPLLRKAVEWAEAEAAKAERGEPCQWVQKWWQIAPDVSNGYLKSLRAEANLTPECGTAFCIAGYVCHVTGYEGDLYPDAAAEALGLSGDPGRYGSDGNLLFKAGNSIEDVRRIAEEIAGERL